MCPAAFHVVAPQSVADDRAVNRLQASDIDSSTGLRQTLPAVLSLRAVSRSIQLAKASGLTSPGHHLARESQLEK